MGYTITEKILARAAGLPAVRAGQDIKAKPDFVLAYDFPGYTDVYFKTMKEDFGIARVAEPERFGIFIDHMVPTATAKEEELHINTRNWCAENDVPLFERHGIGHQVAAEVGYATPGAFVVHFDGHVSQLGTFGTLAIGLRRNVMEAFVSDTVSIRVPDTVRVNLHGSLRPGVMARDVFHHLVRRLGPSSCRFQVLELGGPSVAAMSTEGLQTITGLAMFTGALTAIVNPDPVRLDYALPRARKTLEPVSSDPDARYSAVHDIDLSELEPIVVVPPTPADTRDLTEFLGLEINAGYLGSLRVGPAGGSAGGGQGAGGPAGQDRRVPAHRADQPGADGGGGARRAGVDAGGGRRLRLLPQLRLLLRPHRDDDRGAAGGLDRHAERPRPHGQPGFRDLPVQRRGRRRVRHRRPDRRSAPLSVRPR